MGLVKVLIAFAIYAGPALAQAASGDGVEVSTLSTRREMVSGGDVLVRIVTQSSDGDIRVLVNGLAASVESKPIGNGATTIARVTDLNLGRNEITVTIPRHPPARLTVVNHAIAGPVLSGPHQTPFICETEGFGFGAPLDADCTVPTRIEYFYRSTTSAFKPYNPSATRPADLASTTTLDGKTVPYIVRREMGTINRAVYVIAFLHQPGSPLPDPWNSGTTSWNGRLVYSFGAGCRAGYHQGKTVGGLLGSRSFLEESQLSDYAIATGYAIASSSLNVFDTSCSDVISAETMMMVKEHFIEQFGVPIYTIGSGRSGGSMQQHLIANNYPGLLDGIIPTASFPDTFAFVNHVSDCELLEHAFDASALAWTDEQKGAVSGEANWRYCTQNGTNVRLVLATFCDGALQSSEIYHPESNRSGVRCTYHDNLVNVFGRDAVTGFARRPFDNVGIQYGLKALNERKITFEQFIDLNLRIGGHDIDGRIVNERTVADPDALRIAFHSGRVNGTGNGMSMIPIIDVRPYTDASGDPHDAVNSFATRARLLAANGTSANQILHIYEAGTDIQRVQRENLRQMDEWLSAISRDKAPAGTFIEKVVRNRPAGVEDSCYTSDGQKIANLSRCIEMFPAYGNPRMNAGMPVGSTVLKCALKPIDRRDYSPMLTDVQMASLRALFPSGVCDYSQPGISAQNSETWLSYE